MAAIGCVHPIKDPGNYHARRIRTCPARWRRPGGFRRLHGQRNGLIAGDGRFAGGDNPSVEFLLRAWIWPSNTDFAIILAIGCMNAFGGYLISQGYTGWPKPVWLRRSNMLPCRLPFCGASCFGAIGRTAWHGSALCSSAVPGFSSPTAKGGADAGLRGGDRSEGNHRPKFQSARTGLFCARV